MRLVLGYVNINAYRRGNLTDEKRRKWFIYTQGQDPDETVCSGNNPPVGGMVLYWDSWHGMQGQNRAGVAPGSPATVPIN